MNINRPPYKLLLLAATTIAVLATQLDAPVEAQAATAHVSIEKPYAVPEWQTAAGGRMEFEVASVRLTSPGSPYRGNVDLDSSDYFRYTGGPVTATGRLVEYILFAYKISDMSQYEALQAQLPKWAQTEQFYLEARAGTNPTKDQMRLMVQSLLADRFKLAVHTETRQLPVYALTLDKPGKTGPTLRPHPDDDLCSKVPDMSVPLSKGPGLPAFCGLTFWRNNGQWHMRLMDFTVEQIAGQLATTAANMGGLDLRPVLDETGLHGRFDFDLEFLRALNGVRRPSDDAEPQEPGLTFVEALKSQAGLRLVKQTGPVEEVVVDHVEMPSEN